MSNEVRKLRLYDISSRIMFQTIVKQLCCGSKFMSAMFSLMFIVNQIYVE